MNSFGSEGTEFIPPNTVYKYKYKIIYKLLDFNLRIRTNVSWKTI